MKNQNAYLKKHQQQPPYRDKIEAPVANYYNIYATKPDYDHALNNTRLWLIDKGEDRGATETPTIAA
jgi:hypothetical protein